MKTPRKLCVLFGAVICALSVQHIVVAAESGDIKPPSELSDALKRDGLKAQNAVGGPGGNSPRSYSPHLPGNVKITKIIVYYGDLLDGLVFELSDGSKWEIGGKGQNDAINVGSIDLPAGDTITGIDVDRAQRHTRHHDDDVIGAICFHIRDHTGKESSQTFRGRLAKNPVRSLVPDQNWEICGIWGTCGQLVDSIGIIERPFSP